MIIGNSIQIGEGSTTTTTYSSDALAVFAKMTNLNTSHKAAIDRWITKAKSRGHYTGCLDQFVLCGGLGSASNGLVDWINTSNFTTSGTAPTWNDASGYTSNGTSSYLNANFIPSTAFVNAALNDHFYFIVVKDRSTADGVAATSWGVIGSTTNLQAATSQTTGGAGFKNGSSGTTISTYYTNLRKNSMHMNIRSDASTVRYGVNGQQTQTNSSITNLGLPNRTIYLGARNNNGTADLFIGQDILCWGIGKYSALVTPQLFWVDLETMLMELGMLPKSGTYGVGEGFSNPNDALVVLMAGQSLEAGSNSSTPYASLTGPLDARIAYRNTFAGAFTVNQLQNGVNQNWENIANWGIELRLAKELSSSHPNQRVVLIKYGYSGSCMYSSPTVYDWNMSTSPLEGEADFKNRFIFPALSQLQSEGKNIRIVAFDWYQGQADAIGDDSGNPTDYKANFTPFLKALLDDLINAGYDTSRMWVIVHRILNRYSPVRPYADAVRAYQDALANFLTDNPTYAGKVAGVVVSDGDDLVNDSDTIHESYFAPDVRAARVARFIKSKL
jgi:hypothetical protein